MNVNVCVTVGGDVGEGEAVNVSAAKKVGRTGAVAVEEGSGRNVQTGATVEVGEVGAASASPPHPIKKRMTPVMNAKYFFNGLQRVIEIPQ